VGAVCLLVAFTLFALYDYRLHVDASRVAGDIRSIALPSGSLAAQ
jgi:hypothetical protein